MADRTYELVFYGLNGQVDSEQDYYDRETALRCDATDFLVGQLREILEGVPLNSVEIVLWIRDFMNDNMRIINGGKHL